MIYKTYKLPILLLFLLLCACSSQPSSTPASSPQPASGAGTATPTRGNAQSGIDTLEAFEHSTFYVNNNLVKKSRLKLSDGNDGSIYEIITDPNISVEVESNNGKLVNLGFVFYERDTLRTPDLTLIYDLLSTIEPNGKLDDNIKASIKNNAEKPIHQIKEAQPITFGRFKIYAGKVGPEQTISIDKL